MSRNLPANQPPGDLAPSVRLPVRPAGANGAGEVAPHDGEPDAGIDRRQALKVMALTAAATGLASCGGEGASPDLTTADDPGAAAATPNPSSNPKARGDAWDPDLIDPVIPWERTLTADELTGLAVLCDVIIPADDHSPSASTLGAHDFIDEWVSAPYEGNQADGVLIRGGLRWLDHEATARFGDRSEETTPGSLSSGTTAPLRFRDLGDDQRTAICDDICHEGTARPEMVMGARFFDRVRFLASTAFWTTPEGMDDLGYVGNVPLPAWDPPPLEVLRHIGLE